MRPWGLGVDLVALAEGGRADRAGIGKEAIVSVSAPSLSCVVSELGIEAWFPATRTYPPISGIPLRDAGGPGRDMCSLVSVPVKPCVVQRSPGFLDLSTPPSPLPSFFSNANI